MCFRPWICIAAVKFVPNFQKSDSVLPHVPGRSPPMAARNYSLPMAALRFVSPSSPLASGWRRLGSATATSVAPFPVPSFPGLVDAFSYRAGKRQRQDAAAEWTTPREPPVWGFLEECVDWGPFNPWSTHSSRRRAEKLWNLKSLDVGQKRFFLELDLGHFFRPPVARFKPSEQQPGQY